LREIEIRFGHRKDLMKRIAAAMLLLSSYCYAQTTNGFAPASTNVWGAEYPRVDASGRAEFRIKAPNATAVKLNFWSNPKLDMVKGTDGFWTATTAPLVPGFHYYNFVIDGVDVNDAGRERKPRRSEGRTFPRSSGRAANSRTCGEPFARRED
jgi:1,4-alpha-glucan branching enzyme